MNPITAPSGLVGPVTPCATCGVEEDEMFTSLLALGRWYCRPHIWWEMEVPAFDVPRGPIRYAGYDKAPHPETRR